MGNLVECKTCKKEVAKTAKTCPHCGVESPNPKNEGLQAFYGFIILLVIVSVIMYSCSGDDRTPEQIAQDKIESDNRECKNTTMAGIMSQGFIKERLRSPATADFPFTPVSVTYLGDCVHVVKSYVDSQNGFGAIVRSNTMVKIKYVKEKENWGAIEVVVK